MLKTIEENNSDRQVIITTHSSFVANKLGLQNLLFINDKKVSYFKKVDEDTQKYFKKLAGFETLRVILSNKSILVEGPSDELIVQKAYQVANNNHLPMQVPSQMVATLTNGKLCFLASATSPMLSDTGKDFSLRSQIQRGLNPTSLGERGFDLYPNDSAMIRIITC